MSDVANHPADRNGGPPSACPYLDPEHAPLPKRGWLRRWPGVTYLLPFAVFMLVGMIEPSPPKPKKADAATGQAAPESSGGISLDAERQRLEEEHSPQMPYKYYPYVYSIKIGLTVLAMLAVIPGYRAFPFRVNGIAWIIGAMGAVAWVGLCRLHLEPKILTPLGLGGILELGRRPGFNPLEQLKDNPQWAYGFLAIRFFGLVVVVSIIEEFFLRGFLMRYVMDVDWPLIPFACVNQLALLVGTAFPMLMHPGELIAAAVWFSMVTWLMLRTKNIWDCVIAHAVTNLLMGLWVLYSGDWWLM